MGLNFIGQKIIFYDANLTSYLQLRYVESLVRHFWLGVPRFTGMFICLFSVPSYLKSVTRETRDVEYIGST